MEALEKGLVQLLPRRDRAGRVVMLVDGKVNHSSSLETVMRIFFYVKMVALRDEESQRKGLVIIYYGYNQPAALPGRPIELCKDWMDLPIRIVSCHFCADGEAMAPAAHKFCETAGKLVVCRFRTHFCPPTECLYRLMTFGILVNESLPIAPDGSLDLIHHRTTVAIWRAREEELESVSARSPLPSTSSSGNARALSPSGSANQLPATLTSPTPATSASSPTFVIPGNMDILMGRGRHPHNCPGTVRLHNMVHDHKAEYDMASKYDKTIIAETIVAKLKLCGCRFIKVSPKNDGSYEVCDHLAARSKVSHAFRHSRSQSRGRSKSAKKRRGKRAGDQGENDITNKRHV
mmetsp:Transcript_6717/g.10320  ORF Transcript_6717/g.10320 Transcript_6717/m.10320 type:complete len:348 (-) Transcript_6717:1328-2371(-)